MSISEISRQTGLAGSYLSRILRGLKMPSSKSLKKLAVVFEVPMDRLYEELKAVGSEIRKAPGELTAERRREIALKGHETRRRRGEEPE